jgi:hypothetical protein
VLSPQQQKDNAATLASFAVVSFGLTVPVTRLRGQWRVTDIKPELAI